MRALNLETKVFWNYNMAKTDKNINNKKKELACLSFPTAG